MALSDVFLSPLGLLGLLSLIPLVILYLLRPDPRRVSVPTLQFLAEDPGGGGISPLLEALRRNLLFFLQLLVLVLLALALAKPYVPVAGGAAGGTTVIVVDASASMATETGQGTRFARALTIASEAATGPTAVVVAGARTRVELEKGPPGAAQQTLDGLRVTDSPTDLGSAISRASTLASQADDSRILVISDFADRGWQTAVQGARARDQTVELRQVNEGGQDNVGIVDLSFQGTTVRATVANTGSQPATRELAFRGQRETLDLQPGDVVTRSFSVPGGGGSMRLSPGDSFPVDDSVGIVAPSDPTVDVVVVTNAENRFLTAALSVLPRAEVTVKNPPTVVEDEADVVVFSKVDPDRLLEGTVASSRDIARDGGGVAIQAQPDLQDVAYGSVLSVEAADVRTTTASRIVTESPLVANIDVPTPDRHVVAELRTDQPSAQMIQAADDDSPLLATARLGSGRTLYYGHMQTDSSFKFSVRYPVFWKRTVDFLADRRPLGDLHRATGGTLQLPNATREGAAGADDGGTVILADEDVYEVGEDRSVAVNLLSSAESDVDASAVRSANGPAGSGAGAGDSETVPRELTPLVVAAALLLVVLEVGYLRYRGDL